MAIDAAFCRTDLPLYANNGAKTLATAEHWFGAARTAGHAIVALVGRGVGIGVIANGKIAGGSWGGAGEAGHMKVSPGGPDCACGGRGCLEAYVGGEAILRRWREAGAEVAREDAQALTELLAAAEDGDARAIGVVDETIEILGLGLGNLVNLFNPEQVVVGGWAGQLLYQARGDQLGRMLREFSLDRPAEQVSLASCLLGDDAVALGAALLPLERLIMGDIPAPKGNA
jgi:predicted NBD/HSP70 family sugar kinase